MEGAAEDAAQPDSVDQIKQLTGHHSMRRKFKTSEEKQSKEA